MSEVEVEIFCDSERLHIKEGLVMVDDDQGVFFNLKMPRTAVQVTRLRQ